MPESKGSDISGRKRDHIRIALEGKAEYKQKTTWLEYVHLPHSAVPELDFDEIDLKTRFLGRDFGAPILIEGMTGGAEESAEINANLAEGAERYNLPMGIGSQRAGILNPELAYTFRVAREKGSHVFLLANIGAAQLIQGGAEVAWKAVKMVDADALVVHVNPLQELIQPGGDTAFSGLLRRLKDVTTQIGVPVIVKEVGCGLSYEDAEKLRDVGVAAIDVAGAGGTNWTEIERVRALQKGDFEKASLAKLYNEWGIPTAASVMEVSSVEGIEVVGSGGVRNGLDIAKLLSLGAKTCGVARPFLQAAASGAEEVVKLIERLMLEVKSALFLTGSANVEELRKKRPVVLGPLHEWYEQRVVKRQR